MPINNPYRTLTPFKRATLPAIGGVCGWWYTEISNIATFPEINPNTQTFTKEPTLKQGASWFPVQVPDKSRGWNEVKDTTAAGPLYKETLEGFLPGNDPDNHITISNMDGLQFCVIAKLRSSSKYIILGNNVRGMQLDHAAGSGTGSMDTPGTKLTFKQEAAYKAPLLDAFSLDLDRTAPTLTHIFEIQFENHFE